MTSSRPRWVMLFVLLVVVLGCYLRLIAMEQTRIEDPIRGDARIYVSYAFNLQHFGVFSNQIPDTPEKAPVPDAFVPPGYPLFLSELFDFKQINASVIRIGYVQALLSLVTLLVYWLLFRRFLTPAWALAAAFLTAICPHLVNASVYLLTETLFTLALALLLLALDQAERSRKPALFVVAGVLLGTATLIRPTTLLFLLPLALWLWWTPGTPGSRFKRLLLIALPFVVMQGAWMARNLRETGHASDPALSASFIQHGSYVNLEYDDRPESYGYPYRFDPDNDRIHGKPDLILRSLLERARRAPLKYLQWYALGKPVQFLAWNLTESIGDAFIYAPARTPYADQPVFLATHALAQIAHWPLVALALITALACLWRPPANTTATLFALCLLYFIGFHMIGAPFPRYSIPVRPVLYGLAMFGPQAVMAMWVRRRSHPSRAGAAAAG